ncbi:MAG: hypothetical protein Q8N79_08655 [Candidatus Methanoperedens sp.]|nr:hypothetical protein [Candidatus Methanoperedens sp.]
MIQREQVLSYLRGKQESCGGYTGTDLTELAKFLDVTPRGLNRRLAYWIRIDQEFSRFIYLGKEKPSITLFEFLEIEQRFSENPAQVRKISYDEIQTKRDSENLEHLQKSTFYRKVEQALLSQFSYETEYRWFETEKITLPEDYSLEKNREILSTLFTFSDLKTYGGANLGAIHERLMKTKEWFSVYKVSAMRFYPRILTRNRFLKNILSSIHPDQKKAAQIRLTFEMQAAYIVECMDLFIDEIIHEQGRMQQSDNALRQKTENEFRKDALDKLRDDIKQLAKSGTIDSNTLIKYSDVLIDEELLTRIKLLKKHTGNYQFIFKLLNDLTSNLTQGVTFHRVEANMIYRLAAGELTWKNLNEKEKSSIARNPDLVYAIDNGYEDIIPSLAISRFIEYIRHGKVTFEESYYYQDIGQRIKNVEILENECYLTSDILEQLSKGTFSINANFLLNPCKTEIESSDDEIPSSWTNLSDILNEVSSYVRSSIPGWFSEHQELFKMQTDNLFSMEYTEDEFAERLYNSIGFLGRNFRFRDSDIFMNLKYFIQRHVSDATLRLELKFIHKCFEQITNKKIEGVVIDTMGVDARIKSILSTYHGRYHTIGFSDLRAVAIDMTPVYSGVCRSTDSEAMNIVEVIDEVKDVCGDNVHIYTGNGHTTTKISAGMVYLSHGVIAAGRFNHEHNKNFGNRRLSKLEKNIVLLNKVGKLLNQEPTLGRVIAMRKHIYVDGLNVRKMVEDIGSLILKNVSQTDIPIDEICDAVERSNHMKKKARIVEGSRTRVEGDEAELLLKSGELILCIVGLYHLLKGWKGPISPINFSDVRLILPA